MQRFDASDEKQWAARFPVRLPVGGAGAIMNGLEVA
jgi:hypothetical protein